LIEIEQEIAQFLFYPHTKALAFFAACPVGSRSDSFGVRTLAITWLDTSETVFIGTSEFSKEMLSFLSISERFEPRVERISFFFSHGPVLNFIVACSTNSKASLANLIRLSIWSPVSAKSSSRAYYSSTLI